MQGGDEIISGEVQMGWRLKDYSRKISMSGCFCLFSIHFVIGPISYQKKYQNFEPLYFGQKTAGEATFANPVGPRHT